jgi:hypothetical protein
LILGIPTQVSPGFCTNKLTIAQNHHGLATKSVGTKKKKKKKSINPNQLRLEFAGKAGATKLVEEQGKKSKQLVLIIIRSSRTGLDTNTHTGPVVITFLFGPESHHSLS